MLLLPTSELTAKTLVAEYGVCEDARGLEVAGVSCRDVYAKCECIIRATG